MTALERIEWLKSKEEHYRGHPDVIFTAILEDQKFLLRAFEAMKRVAMRYRGIQVKEIHGSKNYVLIDPENVDQDFEKEIEAPL
jgi:hypothetical protein